MLHPLVLLLVLVVFLHDALGGAALAASLGPAAIVAASILPLLLVVALAHARIASLSRTLDATGDVRSLRGAELVLAGSRALIGAAHTAAILLFGLLDVVREAVGDLVLVDETIATLPALLAFAAGWWSFYPVERSVREAVLLRALDTAGPIYAPPTRGAYMLDRVRHLALMPLIPMAVMLAWIEALGPISRWLDGRGWWPADAAAADAAYAALQLSGVAAVFLLTPPLVRVLWSTASLGPGPVRQRLADLCRRQGVRCRDILVWRTHGMMLNAAVLGFLAPVRYILLTDLLLETLPEKQVEAVMAHEVGHVRRHHLPWLLAAMIAGLGLVSAALFRIADAAIARTGAQPGDTAVGAISAAILLASIGVAFALLGFVSRRFERQADAFAVQHLSGLTRRNARGAGLTATAEAVQAMRGALDSVAMVNHVPRTRRAWRHGSIASRQHAIDSLLGVPLDRFPIDRAARRVKLVTLAALLLFAVLVAFDAREAFRSEAAGPAPASSTIGHRP